jgi:hypothetical protein
MGMNKTIWMGLLVASALLGAQQSAMAQGGLWDRLVGPRNFDECVLRNIRGATSNDARSAIYVACRNLFPNQQEYQPIVDISAHFPETVNIVRHINTRNYTDGSEFGFTFNNQVDGFVINLFRIEFMQGGSKTVVNCRPLHSIWPFENVGVDCPFRFIARMGDVEFKVVRIMGRRAYQ